MLTMRDEEVKMEITRVFEDNYGVYGARKGWGSCGARALRWRDARWSG